MTTPSAAVPAASPADSVTGHGAAIRVRGLSKAFGTRAVLQHLDFDVRPGEFVALVGRSGCGKSTLLRLLAALEQPEAGRIEIDGRPLRREDAAALGVRLVFQDARLLPWKRVADNVGLGLGAAARTEVAQALAAVGLADRGRDWPAALSGGQRQRVALARALVHRPRLLLLDEPLGALDALTRIEMQRLIERLWQQHGCTTVLVTHDIGEAVALADRVLLIEDRRIALDTPVPLPRPRPRGEAAFARLEDALLQRVLQADAPAASASTAGAASAARAASAASPGSPASAAVPPVPA